jgi:hypothetical protein
MIFTSLQVKKSALQYRPRWMRHLFSGEVDCHGCQNLYASSDLFNFFSQRENQDIALGRG